MISASWSVRVERPPEQVFELLADLQREAEWNPDASNPVRTSPGPIGVGSVWERELRLSGHVVSVLESYEPPRLVRFGSTGPWSEAHIVYELAPDGDAATNVSCTIEFTLKGWRRLFEPVQRPRVRRRLRNDRGRHLKRLLET